MKNIIVVLPAYNCEHTLEQTISEIPDMVSSIVLVDDKSTDNTVHLANQLGIEHIITHDFNRGYGGNQKSCYDKALSLGADYVIMLHPDYQYDPKLISPIIELLNNGANVVFGSRMMNGKEALRLGMPLYKYVSNRVLTFFQNILLSKKLSEYHTGYRAFTKEVLSKVPYHTFSEDFIFDNQFILSIFKNGYDITEIYCPARYEKASSSINFIRSLKYGVLVIIETIKYKLRK